jgi:hypothetical protein
MFYVYSIINTVNNKRYIGKASNAHRRWVEHKRIAEAGPELYANKFQYILPVRNYTRLLFQITNQQIADMFGVKKGTIKNIISNKSWKNV